MSTSGVKVTEVFGVDGLTQASIVRALVKFKDGAGGTPNELPPPTVPNLNA